MKKIMLSVMFLVLATFSIVAVAQTYYVSPHLVHVGKDQSRVYDTLSGIIIKTDEACEIPNYKEAALTYNGRARDSLEYKETVHYYNEELGEIEQIEVDTSCKVVGVIGVGVKNNVTIESNATYEKNSGVLIVDRVEVYNGAKYTGDVYNGAIMKLVTNVEQIESGAILFQLMEVTE